ncbi:MAG TPA: hypothetical protein VNT25_06665 [Allosphingosinicella sp.]|nr:hypothetical protein [Allosphingosinicella sp.]
MLRVQFARLDALPDTLGSEGEPLVVMPFTNAVLAKRSAAQLARRADAPGTILCIQDAEEKGFIHVANTAFRRCVSPQFAYVAQDAFAGRRWLAHALEALAKKDGALLGFNDGKWGGALAAFGLVRSDWGRLNYGGDLFFPEYKRHYADVELTLIAMQQRRYRYSPDAILIEVDWKKEGSSVDQADRLLYYRRGQNAYDRKVTDPGLRRLFK